MTAPELAESPAAARHTDSPVSGGLALAAPALIVLTLTVIGFAIRFPIARQSIFADELSTYWISATHGLGGVLSLMYGTGSIPHAEITPPLSFLLFWLSSRLGHAPELVRLPSLIAGTVTIPVVFAIGRRSVGLVAAVVASALTTLSPFMIYYSTEARAYGLMMLAVLLSTLGILLALETGRARWWVLYAVSACAAFYLHYTSVFVLAVQLVWVLWAHPEARRAALWATLAAAIGVLPWVPGLINDFESPTLKILSQLSPFTAHDVRFYLEHWVIGYPLALSLHDVPGVVALVVLGCSAALAIGGLLLRFRGSLITRLEELDRRVVLVAALAVATPVGAALESVVSNSIFSSRNLAASWPYLALFAAAVLTASQRRVAVVATTVAIAALTIATVRLLGSAYNRPDYQGAAAYIEHNARPGDVIVDLTGALSPGPLTGLDVALNTRLAVFRADAPAERGHPYGVYDPIVPLQQAVDQAVAAARGHRVFLVTHLSTRAPHINPAPTEFPRRYRLSTERSFPAFGGPLVAVYGDGAKS